MNSSGADREMITDQMIVDRIYVLRGQKVMIDADLAALYQVEIRRLRTMAGRYPERFPKDFMFKLRAEEVYSLQQQDLKILRQTMVENLPFAFTEQGLAMLAGMLKTERSVIVNVRIIRIFSLIRQILPDYPEVSKIIDQFKHSLIRHK
jgi:hypothetical protein